MTNLGTPLSPSSLPQSTLVILLGASLWPEFDEFESAPAFKRAADKLESCFRDDFQVPRANILNLFDAQDNALVIYEKISNHLDTFKDLACDIILYYIGHGLPTRKGDGLLLPIWATKGHHAEWASLKVEALTGTLKSHANKLRRFYIFDCCYAAKAIPFLQGPIDGMLQSVLGDVEATEKYAALCSSGQGI